MRVTKEFPTDQRADYWLALHCFDRPPLSAAAKGLLAQRLAARRRHLRIGALALAPLPVTAILAGARVALPPLENLLIPSSLTRNQEIKLEFFVATLIVILASLLTQELDRRSDLRLARQLTSRLARGEDISVRTILGPRTSRYATFILIGNSLTAIALMTATHGWKPWVHLAAFALVHAATALAVRRAVNRPTVAVDQESLVVDERLRYQEALNAVSMMSAFLYLELPSIYTELSFGLALLGGTSVAALGILPSMAQRTPPWQRPWSGRRLTTPPEDTDAPL